MTSSESKEPQGSEHSSSDTPFKWCERCGHHVDDHGTRDRHCVWALCACQRLSGGPFGFAVKEEPGKPRPCTCGPDEACGDPCDALDEPPLTPEEEEEFGDCPGWPECPSPGSCPACSAPEEKPPPQPERRPPFLVAYSVSGHLYEVALSGDATVRAVDGALVIQHHLGPVAGIVSVLPVINKESNG